MKARVKETGEIVTIISTDGFSLTDENGNHHFIQDLEEVMPDYWDKLKHQYAGMAMQGLLSNSTYLENFVKYGMKGDSLERVVSTKAIECATALINRLKEEEK